MKYHGFAAALAASLPLLAGCLDRNAANEQNFTRALEPLVADRFCHTIAADWMTTSPQTAADEPLLPLMLRAAPLPRSGGGDRDADVRAMLEGAAHDGMLTRTTTTAPARRQHYSEALAPTALVVYAPTDAGKAVFRAVEQENANHRPQLYSGVCLGRGQVDKIVRWTEPADMFGRTITQVTYRYSAADIPAMVPPNMRAPMTEPKEATVTLMKTSDGWQPVE
ncbi:hypothetical protein [Sphingomonas bacterium]|uniref:hypothetical protein n=1 Tax=Sphingomonas bacterium TaxID=1895847 RepID=UPI0015770E89|nr:hypothetical protein [Sphingomonas bacterium]